MLEARLAAEPSDDDARLLHGLVLSWDGRYDEARQDLAAVVARHPDYRDAVSALIRVEARSGHTAQAEALVRESARRNPRDAAIYREQLQRDSEAPSSWIAALDQTVEWFSDGRTPWSESRFELQKQTGAGPVLARFSQANRFSLSGRQVEVDAYPRIRRGAYAYLNVGYSPDARLYPRYRLGAELYQALGRGWEASAGFRQLHFGSNFNLYTPSISKYRGSWMFSGRLYLAPGAAGTTHTVEFQARRYFRGAGYWAVRYGHGSTIAGAQDLSDLQILNASSLSCEVQRTLRRRLLLRGRLGVSREDRLSAPRLLHYQADIYAGYLF